MSKGRTHDEMKIYSIDNQLNGQWESGDFSANVLAGYNYTKTKSGNAVYYAYGEAQMNYWRWE
ncbi:hypothetical protein [Kordiimonas pumila]|uniref:Uncharacterized protein n=1 Tax=Kordiimonas pumila TaxID=2161677 RepID=A0ABV7D526_9PROT|nr:hypothetical protein [Kordiimonas pumila]